MPIYRVNDIEIDESRREVRRSGNPIPAEPLVFDTLVHLIENRSRAVSRDDLIQEIWHGRVVSDSALTQSIAKARRLFGGETDSVIKTVHRVGYRFIAPVQIIDSELAPVGVPTRRRLGMQLLLLALAGVGLVSVLSWLSTRGDGAHAELTEPVWVTLIPFAGATDDQQLSAQLLTDALRFRLHEIDGLQVRDSNFAAERFDPAQPQSTGAALNVEWIFGGEIEPTEGASSDRVTVKLWDALRGSEFSLGVFSAPPASDLSSTRQFIELRDTIINRALARMPKHLTATTPIADLPEDIVDFELYGQGQARLEQERCDPQLVGDLQPLVERTPGFTQGWMALAWAHWVSYWACSTGERSLDGALLAADQVLAQSPGQSQAIKVQASVFAARGDAARGLEIVDGALANRAEQAALWSTRSYLLNYLGRLEESGQAMDRALQLDPLVLVAETGETPNIYIYLTQWERYLETQPPFDSPYFNFQRAYALTRLGQFSQALEVIRRTEARWPGEMYTRFSAVLSNVINNNNQGAGTILGGIMEERDRAGDADGEAAYREAVLLLLSDHPTAAVTRLSKASELGFDCRQCVLLDPLWRQLLHDDTISKWLGDG